MIEVAPVEPKDLPAVCSVVETSFGRPGMGDRIRDLYALQPGLWFCTRKLERIAGAVGGFSYGTSASIGMLGVVPEAQGQGLGLALMQHILAVLDAAGCLSIFLEASASGAQLYPRLGFAAGGKTLRMGNPGYAPAAWPGGVVRPMGPADLPAVTALDGRILGAGRPEVIHQIHARCPGRAFVTYDPAGNLEGYLFAEPSHIGPWSALSPAAAEPLLRAGLSLPYDDEPRLTFPSENAACGALLATYGFVEFERLLHMRRGGESDPRQVRCLYGQASLSLG